MKFAKYEGLGNDFLIVEAADVQALSREQVRTLCDRHRGVGGDGVLVVQRRGDAFGMQVLNADGSEPEMCGNGLRCVALYLVRTGRADPKRTFSIDTGAGLHSCVVDDAGPSASVAIEMRAPTFAPSEVPIRSETPWIDAPFEVETDTLRISAVGMGNPHAVTFDEVGERRLSLGPRIERDPRFPAGVNVGFATPTKDGFDLRVWERGVGWTEACGTGACAAAAAAVETGRARRGVPIVVRLPGGILEIVIGEPGARARMTGPARHVFDGVFRADRDPRDFDLAYAPASR